jgi:hypothetical protein
VFPVLQRPPQSTTADSAALLARIATLEALLGVPATLQDPAAASAAAGAAAPAPAPAAAEELAQLQKALARANYRILHLSRAYDALVAAAPPAAPAPQ